jgi:hypothetical protein
MVMDPYGRQTRRLSPEALAIREVLSEATDPDELVFVSLPRALGADAISPSMPKDEDAARNYVDHLTTALDELSGARTALRREVVGVIAQEFRLPADLAELRAGLTERLRGFANAPLELSLQGFVSRVLNESLPDEDWLDPLIIRLTNKALGDWNDRDVEAFPRQVREVARALDRVSHLYEAQETQSSSDDKAAEPRRIDTHLLTLTTPSGTEERTLIHVPRQSRQTADELVVSVIKQAEDALGPDGARILLAALIEHLAAKDSAAQPHTKETP